MNTLIRFILASLLAFAGLSAQAATINICDCQAGHDTGCVPGSSGNPGTAASPKQTIEGMSLTSSNTYAFCMGGALTGLSTISPPGGSSAAARTIFTSYSSPNFTSSASPLLTFNTGGFNVSKACHVEIGNISLIGPNALGSANKGIVVANSCDVYQHDLDVTQFDFGLHISEGDVSARNTDISYINVRSHHNLEMGLEGVADRMLVQGGRYDHNGTTSAADHNIYLGAVDYRNDSVTIRGVTLDNNTPYSVGAAGKCDAVSLVAHGPITNLLIEENRIDEPNGTGNCYGIAVTHDTGGSVNPHNFKGLIIRGNKISLNGAVQTGITWNSGTGAIVENNQVWMKTSATGVVGIDFDGGMWTGGSPTGVARGDVYGSYNTVRNNSVYIEFTVSAPNGSIACVQAGAGGSIGANAHDVVVNNLCYLKGNSGDTSSLRAFNVNGRAISTFDAWDYNLAFCSSCTTITWADNTKTTLTNARSAGFDTNSVNADPVFVALPASGNTYDFSIQTSSPAKNVGHPTRSSRTAYGRYMTNGQRDIGSDEFGATVVAPMGAGVGQRF